MTCKELIDFLLDYYEGNLPPDRRREFEKHLAICPDCVAYLNSYKETVELVKAVGQGDNPAEEADVPRSLLDAVLAAQQK